MWTSLKFHRWTTKMSHLYFTGLQSISHLSCRDPIIFSRYVFLWVVHYFGLVTTCLFVTEVSDTAFQGLVYHARCVSWHLWLKMLKTFFELWLWKRTLGALESRLKFLVSHSNPCCHLASTKVIPIVSLETRWKQEQLWRKEEKQEVGFFLSLHISLCCSVVRANSMSRRLWTNLFF